MSNKLDRVLVLLEALCVAWDVKIPEQPNKPDRVNKPKVTKKFTKGRVYGPRSVTRPKPRGVANHYEDWTKEDDKELLAMWMQDQSWDTIARKLGRTSHSVRCRCSKLCNR